MDFAAAVVSNSLCEWMTSVGFTQKLSSGLYPDCICLTNHGRDNQRKLLGPGKNSEQI